MLADTLAVGTGTLSRDTTDTQSGTVWSLPDGLGSLPVTLTVKQTKPVLGTAGVLRSLIQLSYPQYVTGINSESEEINVQTGKLITINMTIARPNFPSNGVGETSALTDFVKLISDGANLDAFTEGVMAGKL